MAHDGFLGSFHALAMAWPYPDCPMPFDTLHHAAMDAALDVSALSSLVPSPSSLPAAAAAGDGVAGYGSCYSTPASSPTKKSMPAQLSADPVLVARLSCLASGGGRLSRVASSQSLLAEPQPPPPPEAPVVAQLAASDTSCSDGHCRKRKAGVKTKAKEAASMDGTKMSNMEVSAKKCKLSADIEEGGERDDETKEVAAAAAALAGEARQGKGKEGNAKNGDPPKDYIHVRARRGQATDSHSLAERVRREKISERMKLLQDLVPGCSKVTGKAVMLGEIINYVQSLQRQVEFLSMKLAIVNPQLDFNVDNFLPKDVHQPCESMPPVPPAPVYSLEASSSVFSYTSQSQGTAMHSVVTNGTGMVTPYASLGMSHPHLDGYQSANNKPGNLWEDDLQSVVQMRLRGRT